MVEMHNVTDDTHRLDVGVTSERTSYRCDSPPTTHPPFSTEDLDFQQLPSLTVMSLI